MLVQYEMETNRLHQAVGSESMSGNTLEVTQQQLSVKQKQKWREKVARNQDYKSATISGGIAFIPGLFRGT